MVQLLVPVYFSPLYEEFSDHYTMGHKNYMVFPKLIVYVLAKKHLIDQFWTLACAPSVLIEKSTQNSKSIMYLGANDVKLDMLW